MTAGTSNYLYANANPLAFSDPTGGRARVCCRRLGGVLRPTRARHCFIQTQTSKHGDETWGLYKHERLLRGCKGHNHRLDMDAMRERARQEEAGETTREILCGDWEGDCLTRDCIRDAFNEYPNPSRYGGVGSNSNTFAGTLSRACGGEDGLPDPPRVDRNAPGYRNRPARPTRGSANCPDPYNTAEWR